MTDPRIAVLSALSSPGWHPVPEAHGMPWGEAEELLAAYDASRAAVPSQPAELAALAVNAGRALADEKRHYEIACQETARLRAVVARLRQMTDHWEQQLPEVIRTPAVVSAIRAVLERAETAPSASAARAALPSSFVLWLDASDGSVPTHDGIVWPDGTATVHHRHFGHTTTHSDPEAARHAAHGKQGRIVWPETAPAARAAEWRAAADHLDTHAASVADVSDNPASFVAKARIHDAAVWREAAVELRRMADEAEYVATPCSFGACEPGGESCTTHERLMAHAEGDHELCEPDCGPSRMADEAQQPETQAFVCKCPAELCHCGHHAAVSQPGKEA